MAFFEDLGKKVSQTSQDAIKKTKIMAETSKIHSQISSEKRKIADNYSKIGEKYFELFFDSADENLSGFISEIREAQQRIEEYEEQIKKLKGIECCVNCGAALKEGALFCTSCGTKSPQPQPVEQEAAQVVCVCSSCGKQLTEGALFCSGCGAKAEQADRRVSVY